MKQTGLIILMALSLGLAGCSKRAAPEHAHAQRGSSSNAESNSREVVTAVVEPRPLPDYLEIPAHIAPDPTRVVRVYSPVGGRLVAFKVTPGERVKTGETVAVLESSDVSAALTAYTKAKTDLELKREALRRASVLYNRGALALKDFQQAQADFAMAQAGLENASRQLAILDVNPNDSSDEIHVAAPRSGVVLQISAAAGEYSKSLDSSQPLCVIADLRDVWAVGNLLESDLSYVKVGDPVELTLVAYPGETLRGRISLISSTVDPTTRTLRLRVVLRNEGDELRPDMYGTLKLLRASRIGFAVPAAAVMREGPASFVFVEAGSGRYEPRQVTLGPTLGDGEVEITGGLKPSERIVIKGAPLLEGLLSNS